MAHNLGEWFVNLKKLVYYSRRFRTRHFKLGFRYLFNLAISLLWPPPRSKKSIARETFTSSWIFPRISFAIGITVYNQSKAELARSFDSALFQSLKANEIIVVNDGSTNPETLAFLDHIKESGKQIQIVSTENKGVIHARNLVLKLVTAKYVLFLDPDDELKLDYLERAKIEILSNETTDVFFTNVEIVSETKTTIWKTGPFLEKFLMVQNTIPMSSVIKTETIKDLRGFARDFELGLEDWDLWVRACLSGATAKHLDFVGYRYFEKPISRSSEAQKYQGYLTELIKQRSLQLPYGVTLDHLLSIKVFLISPWYIDGGGVDKLIGSFIERFKNKHVALITTEPTPEGYKSKINSNLKREIPIVNRFEFKSDEDFLVQMKRLSSSDSLIINFNSPWALKNARRLKEISKKHFVFEFNELGRDRAMKSLTNLDEIWLSHNGLLEDVKSQLSQQSLKKYRTVHVGIKHGVVVKPNTQDRYSPTDSIKVGWLGRLSPEKDPMMFLEVASYFEDTSVEFKIAGDGPMRHLVMERIQRSSNITYEGFVESGNQFLQEIDILMLTSEIEGIPLVAMEALANGRYVVAPNIGGMPDLIKKISDGILYERNLTSAVDSLKHATFLLKENKNRPMLPPEFYEEEMFNLIERIVNL